MTNESFIAAMERMSGLELDGFARRFIYGTGIPEVYYAWRTEERDGGAWAVTGEAQLVADPAYEFAADGDTVLVSEGIYAENIRYRAKAIVVASLYLIGKDTTHIAKTTIDGSSSTQADSGHIGGVLI